MIPGGQGGGRGEGGEGREAQALQSMLWRVGCNPYGPQKGMRVPCLVPAAFTSVFPDSDSEISFLGRILH